MRESGSAGTCSRGACLYLGVVERVEEHLVLVRATKVAKPLYHFPWVPATHVAAGRIRSWRVAAVPREHEPSARTPWSHSRAREPGSTNVTAACGRVCMCASCVWCGRAGIWACGLARRRDAARH